MTTEQVNCVPWPCKQPYIIPKLRPPDGYDVIAVESYQDTVRVTAMKKIGFQQHDWKNKFSVSFNEKHYRQNRESCLAEFYKQAKN